MAYQIDFSDAIWAGRKWRKRLVQLLLFAMVCGLVWAAYDVHVTYHEPTLNMCLASYKSVALPVEQISKKWDDVSKEYGDMARYYRLIWAANPTNFLMPAAFGGAPRLERGFRPMSWSLTTGGDCVLTYQYAFGPGDKALQVKGLEDQVVNLITSVVEVVDGRVEVQGVLHENLLNVDALDVKARFALPNIRMFPAKEGALAGCVAEIKALREKVQKSKIVKGADVKSGPSTALEIMAQYLPKNHEKGRSDFPHVESVIDVAGWFEEADSFIVRHKLPGDAGTRRQLKDVWDKAGKARWPWERYWYRILDTEEIASRTKALGSVSDGVRRFKGFLEKRQADCQRKLEPFIEAYPHNDVFNNPFIEVDLKDRVAKNAGIVRSLVAFKDEPDAEPVVLAKKDEKFTFTWVRWTLSLGDCTGQKDEREQSQAGNAEEKRLTLSMLADCVRRTLTLGPGYALEKLRVEFAEDGNVSGAVLEGLLPVKKVAQLKEPDSNVN